MRPQPPATPGAAWQCLAVCLAAAALLEARPDYGNRLGSPAPEKRVYLASGPSVDMTAFDPAVQRWYLPQELYAEYGRRQWHFTNYARERYLRYLSPSHEGQFHYDVYGELITRGWLIYDWRQTQPLTFESSEVSKHQRYADWFQRLIVTSDAAGSFSYSVAIGDEISTVLTPMTFRKAGFNGLVLSMAASGFRATGVFSRVSAPKLLIVPELPTERQSNSTNLAGGRLEADLGGGVTLGATFVNAHNTNGSRRFEGNPFSGQLTSGQLGRRQNLLVVRISDDSPEDGAGGAVLYGAEVEITTRIERLLAVGDSVVRVMADTVLTGSSLGFRPAIAGGSMREGFLTADGGEGITLTWALAPDEPAGEEGTLRLALQQGLGMTLSEAEDAVTAIERVRFRILLANDYRVAVASDRQTSAAGQPQFLTVARAPGNITNGTNQREVVFDFGLPTATQVYGLSAEIRGFHGFDFYGELNINNRFRKYPGGANPGHRAISGIAGDRRAVGWMANLSKRFASARLFAEAFGMDHDYTTDMLLVDGRGLTDYSPEARDLSFDFVDDNDDNDRHPDQLRLFQGSLIPIPGEEHRAIRVDGREDPEVFPGYDENGDFISDFNQNNNRHRESFFPDYEEPFMRYYCDRPEFLFGIDLNNNGWVDRFENDDLPDFPYKRDHWGFNLFASIRLGPETKLTAGRLNQDMRASGRRNRTTYGLFTLDRDSPRWGRVRVFDMLKKAADTIPDPLNQWTVPEPRLGQPAPVSGLHRQVPDPLMAADTWINTFYTDWDFSGGGRWSTRHRFKWERVSQREAAAEFPGGGSGGPEGDDGKPGRPIDPQGSGERNGRKTSGFLGLIDKVDYRLSWRFLTFSQMLKSELRDQVPFSRSEDRLRSWDAIFITMVDMPVLPLTNLQLGWEQRWFFDLLADESGAGTGALTGDFRGIALALQLTNQRDYVGYLLTTQLGIRYDRRSLEVGGGDRSARTAGLTFLTVFVEL